MDPFVKYLLHAKELMKNISSRANLGLHIVMGNESCDLDSMISALALAYLRFQDNKNVIALMNINAKDFDLRTENTYILKKLGIDRNFLIFRDTVSLEEHLQKGPLKLSLVDHHILGDKDKHLASSVIEIFDHRPLDPQFSWGNDVHMVIKPVGSCATLITDAILFHCISKSNIMSKSLSNLLYSVITFDTIAFSMEAGKTTPLDTAVFKKLVDYCKLRLDTNEIFDELWKAHNDVSHLTPEQLLNKDLKVVNNVPISGLPMLVEEFFKLPNVDSAINNFCTSKNSIVAIIMGLHVVESKVHRDLTVFHCSGGESLAERIVKSLESREELRLSRAVVGNPNVVYFKQGNIRLSRKHILPIIKKVTG